MRLSRNTKLTDVFSDNRDGPDALGQLRTDSNGEVYRFVQNKHTTDVASGSVVHTIATDTTLGTVARLGATGTNIRLPAGVTVASMPADHYGFIKCRGVATASVEGTTDIAAGDILMGVASQPYLVRATGGGTTSYPGSNIVALSAFTNDATGSIAVKLNVL